MIERKEIISGTEAELLQYFKEKYNLVEKPTDSKSTPCKEECTKKPEPVKNNDPTLRPKYPGPGTLATNKVSTGYSNLFGGTSWGA